jgi:hypothetical protein
VRDGAQPTISFRPSLASAPRSRSLVLSLAAETGWPLKRAMLSAPARALIEARSLPRHVQPRVQERQVVSAPAVFGLKAARSASWSEAY